MKERPKILIVARGAWDDNSGTSSTLSNIFSQYDPEKLAMIYVESKVPNTKCCHTFFQIPEIKMLKQILHRSIEIGQRVELQLPNEEDVRSEEKMLTFVRGHRSILFTWFRELLWLFGRWRSAALKDFISDFNPDVVWLDGSTNIFLDRLYAYVLKVSCRPGIIYLMDDNYTYESLTAHRYLYHYLHRSSMRKVVNMCKKVLVISPKMKREFDKLFHVDSTIITKGIDYSQLQYKEALPHTPIRLLYMGQIIYGRDYTLAALLKELTVVNSKDIKILLTIFTNNIVPKQLKKLADHCNGVKICKAVPYNEVQSVISENDVLLFMESLSRKYNRDARLSFSTKITDYLASGKCIFAIGPADSAPMEYFQAEDCAIIARDSEGIKRGLSLLSDSQTILEYGKKAFAAGKNNHDKQVMEDRLNNVLKEI